LGRHPTQNRGHSLCRSAQIGHLFSKSLWNRRQAVGISGVRHKSEAQARALAHVRLRCIIAISCDARSFARDARILQDGGWRLTSLTIVDQFRWTTHLESFAMFCR
jgi:23S rRNA (uracil1939-C5)-methyltransferase